MAKIHKFGLANSLLDSPMATWLTLTGTLGGKVRGKEGRREGTRAKSGNQLVYYICIHLLNPHWNMPRQSVISTQQHKLSH